VNGVRTYINIRYEDRESVKALGCKWDSNEKSWYYYKDLMSKDNQLILAEMVVEDFDYDDDSGTVDECDGRFIDSFNRRYRSRN
jgi:hypothetical protein